MVARSRYGLVSRRDPEGAARCDRGGEIRRRSELIAEMRWSGSRLVPTGFLCCARHLDVPHPQDRILVLEVDPPGVAQARPNIDAEAPGATVDPVLLAEDGEVLLDEGGGVLILDL